MGDRMSRACSTQPVVTSPVLRFVTYSLMDAYRIIVVHEQNHFVQTTRVMESPGFPA